jgi:hypothetical protein
MQRLVRVDLIFTAGREIRRPIAIDAFNNSPRSIAPKATGDA